MRLVTRDVDGTRAVGEALAGVLRPGDVVVLAGDLGVGKTALAQGIGRGLGVTDRVVSPSFVIVREYEGRLRMNHVDVYRLDRFQELHDLGFEEIVDRDGVTVVEWGDRVVQMLPEHRLEVRLRFDHDVSSRTIECVLSGGTWVERLESLEAALQPWME